MIVIGNSRLTVDIIDPRVDTDRLGSRYCAGGYIWQVYDNDADTSEIDVRQKLTYDKIGRTMLSGPHFPSANPPPFDGQGMPEVFETPLGGGDCEVGGEVCVIGVGSVRKTSDIEPFHPRNNPHVTKSCLWDIDVGSDYTVMTTEQSYNDKSIQLRREVRVVDNCVESITTINNTGGIDVAIRWFSHPFFPINSDLACGKITPPVSLPQNAGYDIDTDGMIRMQPDYNWKKGLFQLLDAPRTKLIFTIPHPVEGTIILDPDYDVCRCPVWANSQTFSFEPFIQRAVTPRDAASWKIRLRLPR